MIYFDNAATSWPKPPGVIDAMVDCMRHAGANPGRSGHRLAIDAAKIVHETREAVSALFHTDDPLRVVFTANITESLNLALQGILCSGDHVITSSMEHNSMMRPLRALEKQGIELTVVPCSPQGVIDPADIVSVMQKNTALIALNHVSNVTGTVQPVAEIGAVARSRDLLLLLDTAQSAGVLDIDMERDGIDLLGFTGHKSLYGPMGTGGLVIGTRIREGRLRPLKTGGTGSGSASENQPSFLPDCYESGTPNTVGLAGLLAGIQWIQKTGISTIREQEKKLTGMLINGLGAIENVRVFGPGDAALQTATISFTCMAGSFSNAGIFFNDEYDLLCRVGLHCSPSSHKTIGTFPEGTVRFGLGYFNTVGEVATALCAVENLVRV